MTATDNAPVLVSIEDRIATVTLNRPHRANAWTGRMYAEYKRTLAALDADDDVRVIIVTGAGNAFCVGGDSEALAGHAERGGYDGGESTNVPNPGVGDSPHLDADIIFQLGISKPIVAAVNGACAGVALALVMWSDIRFASATAKLTTAAPKLGLPAEFGLSWIMPRIIGTTRANDLLLSGRVFTGDETRDWGLWNGVAEDGPGALEMAREWARSLVRTAGPNAVRMTKQQLTHDLLHHDIVDSVRRSMILLDEATKTAEYREGVAALREKRPPNF